MVIKYLVQTKEGMIHGIIILDGSQEIRAQGAISFICNLLKAFD